MKVKILLFPLAVIIALAVGVFWIQPEVSDVLSARVRNNDAQVNLDQINTVVSNIDSLDQNLDARRDDEMFVGNYLPMQESDDRILDQINFLAGGAGVLFISTDLDRVRSAQATSLAAANQSVQESAAMKQAAPSQSFINGGDSSVMQKTPRVDPNAKLRSVDFSITVFGFYENIKGFIDHLYGVNSFQKVVSIKIAKPPENSIGTGIPSSRDSQALIGEIAVRFSSLPATVVIPGSFLDVFNRPEFDFGTVETLRQRVTKEVMPLTVSPSPRQNPFVQ